MSRPGERKVQSTELFTLTWDMGLKKFSAWRKSAVNPALMSAYPRH